VSEQGALERSGELAAHLPGERMEGDSPESDVRPRVLIVDDDEAVGRAHARALVRRGYVVEQATSGNAALAFIREAAFDAIVTDVEMPGMSGVELLQKVRATDLDVPVIFVTGAPSLESAIRALDYGALRYLLKPAELSELVKLVDDAVRLHRIAKAKRAALDLAGGQRFVGDQAGLTASFDRALSSLYVAYQPIVRWTTKQVFAYEALLRSHEPNLQNPLAMVDAAERLGRVHELGYRIRERAVEPLGRLSRDVLLFINLHPTDLIDAALLSTDTALSEYASRIVLEVTERAPLHHIPDVRGRVAALKHRGFRIAIDDLGAGYAGLTSFTMLSPDVVKLDMGLVRDVDREPTKQTIVRTMTTMCHDLGMLVTAEGIETPGERDQLARAGCDLMQGYLFAKPGLAFPDVVY
jgi:EAL domain-containing protein (putative c-di-GMP-specific phosphodiesterase class I)